MKGYTASTSLFLCLFLFSCSAKREPPTYAEHSKKYNSGTEYRRSVEKYKTDHEIAKNKEVYSNREEYNNGIESLKDLSSIRYECEKPEVNDSQCADLYISYREKYKFKNQDTHLLSALLTRYLAQAKRYSEAIEEGRKYLDSGKANDKTTPHVLLWKSLAHFGIGERDEASYLLEYLQEKYPLSEPARISRKFLKEQKQ